MEDTTNTPDTTTNFLNKFEGLKPSIHPKTLVIITTKKTLWSLYFYTGLRKNIPFDKLDEWLFAHGCLIHEDNFPKIDILPNPNYCQEELLSNLQSSLSYWFDTVNSKVGVIKDGDFY